jgi:hypothetical protein
MLESSGLAAQLASSQELLSSMQLFSYDIWDVWYVTGISNGISVSTCSKFASANAFEIEVRLCTLV